MGPGIMRSLEVGSDRYELCGTWSDEIACGGFR